MKGISIWIVHKKTSENFDSFLFNLKWLRKICGYWVILNIAYLSTQDKLWSVDLAVLNDAEKAKEYTQKMRDETTTTTISSWNSLKVINKIVFIL